MTPEVDSLTALKNLILHSVGQQVEKMVKKIYYRYSTEVNDSLFYKRYRLRDYDDVRLIWSWHNRWTNIHLLELFVYLVEVGGRGSSADTVDNNLLNGAVRQTIRRTMVDLNMPPEGSQKGSNIEARNADLMDDGVESHDGSVVRDPMMDQYEVNPDDENVADEKPAEIPDDGDEEDEMNYYGDTQITITQPAISQPYDRPNHFTRLNLDAMTSDWSSTQEGPEEDPSNEFEVGQQFKDKEEVMLAVKQYNIRRAVDYKIVESDQLRQDHGRLDSKVIAQHIFTMVKADPTISIRVLQGGVENHFGYKASYRKVWLAKQRVIARIYGDWDESYNELPRWLFVIQMYFPGKIYFNVGYSPLRNSCVYSKATKFVSLGTWVQLVTQPWPGSTDTVMFHRVFWTFPPCIEAFKHCKTLISIDVHLRVRGIWEQDTPISCTMYPLVHLIKCSSEASCSSSPQTVF
ncbi:uncharacterized protein LOC130979939 [Arachis stenosperma]|uniref:uncharacterized protein LOC130979939 n=1 Tax=Arachis stenosperma TaxID=217475 RepID=UPI0025AC3040|nr:uncharacterized protein LOC130979939 [Arachis stenosperma]